MGYKKGLVLEGGAMRGIFSCGVIDVFMENGIEFDGVVGVSAGACFGCNVKSEQIGRAYRYSRKYGSDYRYGSFKSFFKTGDMYDYDFCYNILPFELDVFDSETYKNSPKEFHIVATDVNTGESVYHVSEGDIKEDLEWIRASASMPLVSNIVHIGDKELLDGGMADAMPLKYFENCGYNRNVVILTQPPEYRKKKNKLMPLIRMKYSKHKGIVHAMDVRHVMYNEQLDYIAKREATGEVIVIRPPKPLNIGKTEKDPLKYDEAYETGRRVGEEYLERVKAFLKE